MEQITQHRGHTSGASVPAGDDRRLQLPDAPASESGSVRAWEQPVLIRTYLPAEPDPNPLFLEKRVYQGSSGRVYPLPVIDRIDSEARNHSWRAVHLENEFIRLMILPEIGGRIHVGLDKLNQYDFFYRQNVIKPALVGLAGPWISGGVEFNWPQHHRPATFMPTEVFIEREPDGSIIVWCSDYDPMTRLKGMHGICLHPHRAVVELRVRLYNTTQDAHTFLWWANTATHVNEAYQSFFPKDAHFVADHARRAITEFPLCQGIYYGVNYGERARRGVPEEEKSGHFVPDGSYPPNDLSWYANIPVPTSYMIVGSRGDFSGGYDHHRDAGMVQYSNHHIAPGKKQWTWGNHKFGYAWDRSLTDSDGPYIELMTGVYTDNQPDFSFLAPGETRTFRQWWYPIRAIGVPDAVTLDAGLRTETASGRITIHLLVTSARPGSTLRLLADGIGRASWHGDLLPETPLHFTFSASVPDSGWEILLEQSGRLLLRYAPSEIVSAEPPVQATEPPSPAETTSSDELFLIGQHLEQYRHPTRSPEPYWREAVRRDPEDSRANHALGRWHLRRGELAEAEKHLRIAIARLTQRNPNPADGEPFYNLGRTLAYQQRFDEAYAAFYKSTWNATWRGPGYHRLAEIDCLRGAWETALDHLDHSLRAGTENLNARNLKTLVLRRLGRIAEADSLLRETRALDPLDSISRCLESGEPPADGQQRMDLGFYFLQAGMLDEALQSASPKPSVRDGSGTMLLYLRAHVLDRLGREQESARARHEAAIADPAYVFPSRIEEMLLLEEAIRKNPRDARAPYYLGNLLYDRKRHREGIAMWERATALDPDFPTAWRNLGFGYFNILRDPDRARQAFARARQLSPCDARVFYEQDQLAKRIGEPPEGRLAALEANRPLVDRRDDLSVELATLYNNTGQPDRALAVLLSRRFQPWEGGEGQVLAQFVRACILLAERALKQNDADTALAHLQAARNPPQSLGEAHHLLVNLSAVDYWLGIAHAHRGESGEAAQWLERAARAQGDFWQMQVEAISGSTWWSALALRRLGREQEADRLFRRIQDYATRLRRQTPTIDYFATSLPAMLLFDEDLEERQQILAGFLEAQALLGLGATAEAIECLRRVLSVDRNHSGAIDLLREQVV